MDILLPSLLNTPKLIILIRLLLHSDKKTTKCNLSDANGISDSCFNTSNLVKVNENNVFNQTIIELHKPCGSVFASFIEHTYTLIHTLSILHWIWLFNYDEQQQHRKLCAQRLFKFHTKLHPDFLIASFLASRKCSVALALAHPHLGGHCYQKATLVPTTNYGVAAAAALNSKVFMAQ